MTENNDNLILLCIEKKLINLIKFILTNHLFDVIIKKKKQRKGGFKVLKYYIVDIKNAKHGVTKSDTGKFGLTTDPAKYDYFSTREKAENVINNCMKNPCKYIVLSAEFDDPIPKKSQIEYIEDDSTEDIEIDFIDIPLTYSLHEIYKNVSKVNMEDLDNEEKRIASKLRTVHKGLTDINHSLELIKLDAVKRGKLSVVQTKLLDKRRELKTDIEIIQRLKSMINPEIKPMIEEKVYTPRIFNELFEGIIPDIDKFLEEL